MFVKDDHVIAKRRTDIGFRVVRRVGDTNFFEVTPVKGGPTRFFMDSDLAPGKAVPKPDESNGSALAKFDHDGDGKPGGSKPKKKNGDAS